MNGDTDLQDRKPVRHKRVVVQAIVGVLILLLFIGAGWYLSSPSFNQLVRSKLVAEMERVTGGRVEIGSFEWNLSELQFDARDITIHGLEAPGQFPYAHIDHAIVRLKIISVIREKIGVRFVGLQHPVVHLITYPDGSTNQPSPKTERLPQQNSVEQLFAVAIQRIDVKNGELILNDRHIPLDFTAADVSARMDYGALPKRYDGQIVLGKLDVRLRDFRPFASVSEARFTIIPNAAQIT
jgi:translocation and assembly module TamB